MISFSGIDCAGKTTQIESLLDYFKKKNIRCMIIHSRGGYTPALEWMKNLIRSDKHGSAEMHAQYREAVHGNPRKRKMLLWMSILDMGLYYGVWFRLLELTGLMILADRYFWDSYIDFLMKYPEHDFKKWLVWKFAKAIYLKPKIALIYTIPADLSMYRSTLKDEPWPEPIEVRVDRIQHYMDEIHNNRWTHVIDATDSIDAVFRKTVDIIENHVEL